jgi:hypothetical protein
MRKIILSMLISFLSLSVTASPYQEYLDKIFSSSYEARREFVTIKQSNELDEWLLKIDNILNTDKVKTFDGDFKFTVDHLGNIDSLEIIELYEDDFEKFKAFISDISTIRLPEYSADLTNFNFSLEASTLYLDRPFSSEFELSANKTIDLETKIGEIETDFTLYKPSYLDYPYIGQEIILKNNQGVFLRSYVTQKHKSKILLNAFQVYDDDEAKKLSLDLELKRVDDKNFIAKLIGSGIANGLKAGIVNSYNSYGIAPGALALMGMAGTAMIEHETEDSFSLMKGENLKIKKVEEK